MKQIPLNIIFNQDSAIRLDAFLAESFSVSRSLVAANIKTGNISVNTLKVKPSYKLRRGDKITGFTEQADEVIQLVPEEFDLDILYEDKNVIVINKPFGMPVHPGAGNLTGTLVNYLLNYLPTITEAVQNQDDDYERVRPGIIHRLDKDTSGIIVVAKNKKALTSISKQIKNRKVKKIYLALCYGWPEENKGTLRNHIGRSTKNRKLMAEVGAEKGRETISKYKVTKYLSDNQNHKFSLIEFNIKTGRTHQIRIQSKIAGFPVLGDSFYGGRESQKVAETKSITRQLLHAKSIDFYLPGETKPSHFEAPLPEDFQKVLESLSIIK